MQEEMDMKVLQFQNRKLTERLEQRQRQESDLRQRIEQLEKRQTSDEAVLCVVNRYWNQVLYLYLIHLFLFSTTMFSFFLKLGNAFSKLLCKIIYNFQVHDFFFSFE